MATNVSSSLPDLPSSHRCGSVSNHLWIPAAFPHHGRPTNTAPILKGFSVAISVTSRGGTNGSNPLSSSAESASNRSHGVRGQMSANHRLASRPTLGHDACGQYRGEKACRRYAQQHEGDEG